MSKILKLKVALASSELFSYIFKHIMIWNEKVFNYKYKSEKYGLSFITKKDITFEELKPAPKVIYTFWTGTNEMSASRKLGIKTMRENSGIELIVITPDNLKEYILEEYPLHKAFENLSLVHKSDYLRCYFMLHYGGGYSDVKPCRKNWENAFQKLNESSKYVLGYREILGGVPRLEEKDSLIAKDIKKYYFKIIGVCSFIFKPYSPIAIEWMEELNIRMEKLSDKLEQNPGNIWGNNRGYPVIWNYILSQIVHPLFLKYNNYIILDDDIRPVFKNYR